MKAMLFIAGFFFVLSSFGSGLEKSQISNFSGSYVQDRGSAKADVWLLAGGERQENVTFEVFKENQQLRLITPSDEYLFDEVPEFLLELDEVRWSGANATTGGQSVGLSLVELSGSGVGNELDLRRLNGQCRGGALNGDFFQNLISACTTSGNLTFSKLVTVETPTRSGTTLFQFFEGIIAGLRPQKSQTSLTLENFDLKVNNKKYELKVKADLSISATIRANGSFEYSQDRIKVRIDRVRASFLNVTSKVFDELEKIQSPNVIVARPYVTILVTN